ncbi:MAG: YcxB family protein [Alphaproteobacteria bacterium]|nr:MAG: YcxB family protein [Alphaproteobacteria bacterium]
MEHETTLEYSVPLLREAVAGFWRRSVGMGMLIALAICAGMLGVLLAQGDKSWVVGLLGAVVTLGAAFVVAIYAVHYRNAIQKFRDMGSPRATFRASDNSFTVSSDLATSTVPWSTVTQIWKFKNCWLLLFSKAQFMTLPLASVPQDMQVFVLERVAAAGGRTDG